MIYSNNQFFCIFKTSKNSGSLVAVEGHRQTPKKHTSKPLNWFLCISYIQTALNLAISLLREYQYVCATLCAYFKIDCKITKKIWIGQILGRETFKKVNFAGEMEKNAA